MVANPHPGSQSWSTGVWHGQERTPFVGIAFPLHLGINSQDAMNPKFDRWEQMVRNTGNRL